METCLKKLAQSVGMLCIPILDMKTKLKEFRKRVESMNMTEQIFRVVIPEEEETQVKDGKAKKLVKNIPRLRAS